MKLDFTLYLVTDRNSMSAASLETAVEQAILGGCTMVQLREKDISSDGLAAVSAIISQQDIKYSSSTLKQAFLGGF